jgi:hypothetical protein
MICRSAPLLFLSVSVASLVVGIASCSPEVIVRVADADRPDRPASTSSSGGGGSSDSASDSKSSVGGAAGAMSSGGAGHGGSSSLSSGGQSKTGGTGGKAGASASSSSRGGNRSSDAGVVTPSTRRIDASVVADARSGDEVAPLACDDITSNGRLAVYYYTGNQEPQTQDVNMHLAVVNFTAETARLSQVTVRYWFTDEGAGKSNILAMYYTPPTLAKITTKFLPATPLRIGADTVLEFTFTPSPDAGVTFLETTEFNFAFHKDNYAATYDLANDYSYDGRLNKSFGRNPKITAYLGNQLVWGCEPSVAPDTGRDAGVDAGAGTRDR